MIIHRKSRKKQGRGLVNKIINKLPVELDRPGYQYCSYGTKLAKRLARGDSGIFLLDSVCEEHVRAFSQNPENIEARHVADRVRANKAWNRVRLKDVSIGKKAAASAVSRFDSETR